MATQDGNVLPKRRKTTAYQRVKVGDDRHTRRASKVDEGEMKKNREHLSLGGAGRIKVRHCQRRWTKVRKARGRCLPAQGARAAMLLPSSNVSAQPRQRISGIRVRLREVIRLYCCLRPSVKVS